MRGAGTSTPKRHGAPPPLPAPPPHRTLREDDPWLLQRVLESINSGLIVIDGDERVILYNPAAELITGCPRDEVVGQPFVDCLGPGNREVLTAELVRATSPRENREVTLFTRNGA